MTDLIDIRRDGRVLVIAFNRPDKKNAITHAMYAAVADALEAARTDAAVRVVLFTGNGDAFTAGNDLQDFAAGRAPGEEQPVQRFLKAITRFEKPLVAAVNGLAVGVGTTMLLHCDLVYASETAMFQLPFVDLALVPEAGSSLLLPRLVGHARASEWILLGQKVDAAEALATGLVARVLPPAELLPFALERARRVAAKAPTAVRLTKALLRMPIEAIEQRRDLEGEHFGAQLQSPELQEAIAAFFEKRAPDFDRAA